MRSGSPPTDPRLKGAALALGLDITLFLAAGLLALASFSPALAFVLAAAAGVVVAPILGWRYGRAASTPGGKAWAKDALRTLLAIGLVLTVAWVVVQALNVPVSGGILGRLSLVLYASVVDGIGIALLILATALPLGFVWATLMRKGRRSTN
jgi:hypothetical protein